MSFRRTNHVPYADLGYAIGTFKIVSSDFVLETDHEELFVQMVLLAMESQLNSMPYVYPNWGFPARNNVFGTDEDDLPQYRAEQFVRELLNPKLRTPLGSFLREVLDVAYTFPRLSNSWSFQLQAELDDQDGTAIDRIFTWDGDLQAASVS